MYNDRPHVRHIDCYHCNVTIKPDEVLVYYDSSGRDGPAVDAAHLVCYLRSLDPNLPSNEPLLWWARRAAVEAIDAHFGTTSI